MPRNLVDLIETHDPAQLELLRHRYPASDALLRWDKPLGDADPVANEADLRPRIDLSERGVATLRVRADAIIAELSRRLRHTRRLRTAGAVLAAVTNGGLIASLLQTTGAGQTRQQMLLATIALIASLLSIFAERAAGGPGGGEIAGLFDSAVSLSTKILQADLRRQRLAAQAGSEAVWDELLSELDDIAVSVHGIELKARVL